LLFWKSKKGRRKEKRRNRKNQLSFFLFGNRNKRETCGCSLSSFKIYIIFEEVPLFWKKNWITFLQTDTMYNKNWIKSVNWNNV
jgi:hypothetical protein